ncbi:hypothetical protein EON65_20980 [archaeon]|nr:MAG: hypothetical protein EON65_20980 [archaeon]
MSIRYVGSPYQTSLSESDQQKLLYLLSSAPGDAGSPHRQWKELDRWPIDFGRKYYRVSAHSTGLCICPCTYHACIVFSSSLCVVL